MIIKNVLVYTEDKKFEEGTIYIENCVFANASSIAKKFGAVTFAPKKVGPNK